MKSLLSALRNSTQSLKRGDSSKISSEKLNDNKNAKKAPMGSPVSATEPVVFNVPPPPITEPPKNVLPANAGKMKVSYLVNDTAVPQIAKAAKPESEPSKKPPKPAQVEEVKMKENKEENLLDMTSLKKVLQDNVSSQNEEMYRTRFVMGRVLGSGSYGTVCAAFDTLTGETVAVKKIEKRRVRGKEERIRQELQVLMTLKHPNLLTLKACWFGKTYIYIVTELARGKELFDVIIAKGAFYNKDAAIAIRAMTSAIAFLHENNIIHRDLKPENILVRDPNQCEFSDLVVGDFGIARVLDPKNRWTKTHIGSPGYMAPEMYIGRPYDKAVDMWSIGVIAYILLTGTQPYRADGHHMSHYDAIMNTRLTYEDASWFRAGPFAKDFVKRCLTLNPADRMTAAEAMVHPWLNGATATISTVSTLYEKTQTTNASSSSESSGKKSTEQSSSEPSGNNEDGQIDLMPDLKEILDAYRFNRHINEENAAWIRKRQHSESSFQSEMSSAESLSKYSRSSHGSGTESETEK